MVSNCVLFNLYLEINIINPHHVNIINPQLPFLRCLSFLGTGPQCISGRKCFSTLNISVLIDVKIAFYINKSKCYILEVAFNFS